VAACILTHFNNCNFSKAQILYSLMMVFHTETCSSYFNVNFNANLKLFLRLSNCASVGGKNFDNYQDARYVRGNHESKFQGMIFAVNHLINWCSVLNAAIEL
jgi:hypothetical protein